MTKDLDRESRSKLEEKLDANREESKSKQVRDNFSVDPSTRPDIDSQKKELDDIISDYQSIITLANEVGKLIDDRAKDIEVQFDAEKEISLRDSIRRLFGIDTNIITYQMYKRCLELKEQLSVEDRESMRNQ